MRRSSLLLLVVLVALLGTFLLLGDPLGLLAPEGGGGREEGLLQEERALAGGPTLEGRADAGAAARLAFAGEPVGHRDLGLGPAALRGLVMGAGQPLPGARVRVALPPPDDQRGVQTDEEGAWEIRGLPLGRHEVRASAAGFLGRSALAPDAVADAVVEVEPIDLGRRVAPADGILVRVTDPFGRPVEGAQVLATTILWSLHLALGPELAGERHVVSRTATTDRRGEARMSGLPPETYDVAVVARGFQTAYQSRVVVAGGQVRHLAFTLQPGVAISGVVVDARGGPVGEAYVTALHLPSFSGSLTVRTDETGAFVLDGLREGRYWVLAFHDTEGEGQANPVASPSAGARIALGGTGKVVVTARRKEGAAIPRYELRPFQEQPYGYVFSAVHGVEDPAGRFETALPPGTWHFGVRTDGGDFDATANTTVRVGETSQVEVVVPASGVVRGVIVDPAGHHVPDAQVFVRRGGFPPTPSREQSARSDAEGAFVVPGLPLETVKLHVRHPGFAPAVVEATPAPGESAQEITIRLEAGGAIEGRVTQGGEAPLAREQVNVFQGMNFADAQSTVTDERGGFRFGALADGTYTVSTGPLEAQSRGVVKAGVRVTDSGTTHVDLDVGAERGGGVVEGVVRQAGQAVAGALVSMIDARGYERMVSVTTDDLGRFRGEGMQPGDVTVSVQTGDGMAAVRRVRLPEAGETVTLEIAFGAGALRGRLVTPESTPFSGAWLQVEQVDETAGGAWGRIKASPTTDADGVFRAGGLEPGTYQVRVSGSSYATWLSQPVHVSGDGETDLGTIRLNPGAAIQGRVVDDAGAPVEDVTISLRDAAGRPLFLFSMVTTGSDGRYRVAGLEPGRYVIRFEAGRGHAPASRTVDLGSAGMAVDVALERGGTLEAIVTDDAGQPLPGARVTLRDAGGAAVERTLSLVSLFDGNLGLTNEQGVAVLPDIAAGPYTVSAAKAGWALEGEPAPVRMGSGERTALRLAMRRAP